MTVPNVRDLMAVAINRATGIRDELRFTESEALIDKVLRDAQLSLTADDFPPDSLTAGAFTNLMRQVREADAERDKALLEVKRLAALLELAEKQRADALAQLEGDSTVKRIQASTLRAFAEWAGTVTLVGDPGEVDPAVWPADQRTLRYVAREARRLADARQPA